MCGGMDCFPHPPVDSPAGSEQVWGRMTGKRSESWRIAKIPDDLSGHLPSFFVEMMDIRIIILMACCSFGGMLYAMSRPHNGWIYFLSSALGPVLGALYHWVRPFNPYRHMFAQYERMAETQSKAAEHLVRLLRSREIRALQLKVGLAVSATLLMLTLTICWIKGRPPSWSAANGSYLVGIALFALFTRFFLWPASLRWAFRNWNAHDLNGDR